MCNLKEYAKTMVNCRQSLIDSVEQYIFNYDVLCEAVLCNIQPIGELEQLSSWKASNFFLQKIDTLHKWTLICLAMHELKQRSSMYRSRKDRELMELQDKNESMVCFWILGDSLSKNNRQNNSVASPGYANVNLLQCCLAGLKFI